MAFFNPYIKNIYIIYENVDLPPVLPVKALMSFIPRHKYYFSILMFIWQVTIKYIFHTRYCGRSRAWNYYKDREISAFMELIFFSNRLDFLTVTDNWGPSLDGMRSQGGDEAVLESCWQCRQWPECTQSRYAGDRCDHIQGWGLRSSCKPIGILIDIEGARCIGIHPTAVPACIGFLFLSLYFGPLASHRLASWLTSLSCQWFIKL